MSDKQIIKRLQRLYKDETIAKVIDWIEESGHNGLSDDRPSKNEYDTVVTEARELEAQENPDLDLQRWQVIEVLKALGEKADVGVFITGRRGRETRFEWTYTPSSVAQCAKGEDEVLVPTTPNDNGEDDEGENSPNPSEDTASRHIVEASTKSQSGDKTHRYWLRDDYEVVIKLPSDLTSDETEHLASFVRAIRTSSR